MDCTCPLAGKVVKNTLLNINTLCLNPRAYKVVGGLMPVSFTSSIFCKRIFYQHMPFSKPVCISLRLILAK